jgi:hypothetical protein
LPSVGIRMSQNFCPVCDAVLEASAINIAEGVALCPACGKLSRLAEVAEHKRPLAETLVQTPRGCSIDNQGTEIVVRASLRSTSTFFGALAVCLFWNGIVSVFVLIALAGLYTNLVGPLPVWFPAPDIKETMPLGMTLFLCIFLIPFVTIGLLMVFAVMLALAGKTEVRLTEQQGVVRTGLGFLVWPRRFDPRQVRSVKYGESRWKTSDSPPQKLVMIEADRTIKFGSQLQEDRRAWLMAVLQVLLLPKYEKQRAQILSLATYGGELNVYSKI